MNLQQFSTENILLMEALSEARLCSWSFKEQNLEIHLLSDNDEDIYLYTEVDVLFTGKIKKEVHLNTCRIEIIEARTIFDLKNGYYIPPNNFNGLMKYKDFSFFYARSEEFKYCISFIGYGRLLAFPVKELSDIKFRMQ